MRKIIAYIRGWWAFTHDPVGLAPFGNDELNAIWWRGWEARARQLGEL